MTATVADSLIAAAFSNLVFALPLAALAGWFQARGNRPFLSHLLWLLVLVKLVTPPFYSLPLAFAPIGRQATVPEFDQSTLGMASAGADVVWYQALTWPLALVGIWLIGSAIALTGSVLRAHRFNRLLRQTSIPAEAKLRDAATSIANRLGLMRIPEILATSANISPLVWWVGGAVRVYIPRTMVERMDRVKLGSIVTHELGHVRRGDHFVRWLECAGAVLLWWNPLAWFARRNLRVCEEICCDAFVLAKTDSSRDAYAEALVSAMELLATPSLRPSGLASHVNGGIIERRIRMILSGQSILETPRWLRAVIAAAATFILPLGFTLAQDAGDLDRVQEWIDSGVNSAFLTEEQAEIMMRALRGANGSTEVNVVDDGRNVIVMKRKAMGDGDEVLLDVEYKGAAGGAPVAMAERQLAAQVAAGFISQGEADVVLDDLRNAIANGPSEGVRAFALRPVDGSFEVVTDRGNHSVSVDGDGAIESSAEVVYFDLKRVESDTAE